MVAEHGADSVYKSHSGSIVETSEDLKAKAESQMAEARRTEVTASHNFQMRQQFLEDELKFNAQDLDAAEHSLDEAQGQPTTDTADLKMTEDALAEDTAAPSGTSTFAKTDHVVTDMAKLPDAKNTTRHINLQRSVAKRDMTVSMIDTCATSFSGAT